MLISLLVLLLLSNALTTGKDKSILFSRVVIIAFICTSFLAWNNLFIKPLEKGIGICGGLFNVTTFTQIFNIIILLVIAVILTLIRFYPRKLSVNNISYANVVQVAIILISLPCRKISMIFCLTSENIWVLPLLFGVICTLCAMLKFLCKNNKLPSNKDLLRIFVMSLISASVVNNLPYYKPLVELLLPLYSLEMCQFVFNKVDNNMYFSGENTFSQRRTLNKYNNYPLANYILHLTNLNGSINANINKLPDMHEQYENKRFWARYYRHNGDEINANIWTLSAKQDRQVILQYVNTIDGQVADRENLISQTRQHYPNFWFTPVYSLNYEQEVCLDVASTYATSRAWDI